MSTSTKIGYVSAAFVGITLGAMGHAVMTGSDERATAEDDPPTPTSHRGETAAAADCDCPEVPAPRAGVPAPEPAGPDRNTAARADRKPARNPADHALRWPRDVPERLRPEFVRAVVDKARKECGEALPSQLYVDCKGVPCAIVSRTEHGRDYSSLRDVCERFRDLGELRSYASGHMSGRPGVRVTWQTMRDESQSLKTFETRNELLRRHLTKSGRVEQLDCEFGNPEACASWAQRLAATDLDAAMSRGQSACADGAGLGCTLLAVLGEQPFANFRKGCQLGDPDGCRGAVTAACGVHGETCNEEALEHARSLHKSLESSGAYDHTKREALQTIGKVLCALGRKEEGLKTLTEGCLNNDGQLRKWCDPVEKCDSPYFMRPPLGLF